MVKARFYVRRVRAAIGSAVVALILTLVLAAFAFAGVLTIEGAHICLALAWLVSIVGACTTDTVAGYPPWHVVRVGVLTGIATGIVFLGLDQFIVRKRLEQESAAAKQAANLVLDVDRVTMQTADNTTRLFFTVTVRNEGGVGGIIKSWKLVIKTAEKGTFTPTPGHPSSDVTIPQGDDRDLLLPTHSQDVLDRIEAVTRDNPAVGMLTFEIKGVDEQDIRGACLSLTGLTEDNVVFGEPCLQIDAPAEPVHIPGLREQSIPKTRRE